MLETQSNDLKTKTYVESHLEPFSRKAQDYPEEDVFLETPLAHVEYNQDFGEVVWAAGNIVINYSYEQVNEQTTPRHILKWLPAPAQWRRLKSFIVDNVINGASLDIVNLLPPENHILFKITEGFRKGGSADAKNKAILMRKNLQTPYSPVVLLHEIGHIINDSENPMDEEAAEGIRSMSIFDGPVSLSTQAKILRGERNAWAFAIKKLRPSLKGVEDKEVFNMKRVLNYIHDYSLESYSFALLQRKVAAR